MNTKANRMQYRFSSSGYIKYCYSNSKDSMVIIKPSSIKEADHVHSCRLMITFKLLEHQDQEMALQRRNNRGEGMWEHTFQRPVLLLHHEHFAGFPVEYECSNPDLVCSIRIRSLLACMTGQCDMEYMRAEMKNHQ